MSWYLIQDPLAFCHPVPKIHGCPFENLLRDIVEMHCFLTWLGPYDYIVYVYILSHCFNHIIVTVLQGWSIVAASKNGLDMIPNGTLYLNIVLYF